MDWGTNPSARRPGMLEPVAAVQPLKGLSNTGGYSRSGSSRQGSVTTHGEASSSESNYDSSMGHGAPRPSRTSPVRVGHSVAPNHPRQLASRHSPSVDPSSLSVGPSSGTNENDDDDDIPLAKAIPTALKAQKSIRSLPHRTPRNVPKTTSVSDNPLNIQSNLTPHRRVSSRPSTATSHAPAPDDLTRRLLEIQSEPGNPELSRTKTQTHTPRISGGPSPASPGGTGLTLKLNISHSHESQQNSGYYTPISSGLPRPGLDSISARDTSLDYRSNNVTHSTSRRPSPPNSAGAPPYPIPHDSIKPPVTRSRSKTVDGSKDRPSLQDISVPMPARRPSPSPAPTSLPSSKSTTERPVSWIDFPENGSTSVPLSRQPTSARTPRNQSRDDDRSPAPSHTNRLPITPVSARSPLATKSDWPNPVPVSSASAAYKEEVLAAADIAEEQRVFIENRQRFCLVKIGVSTRARDVLAVVSAKNELHSTSSDDRSVGGWMVYEMANDFGMERPIREYEMIADIFASWNKDMRLNTLMIKKSSLRGPLSFKNMPSSSPIHEGTVYWEARKGKWSKRHLRLREHCLFLSKKDSGKDETLLCSLSNFDAYTMSRVYRSPKPFTFALRSADNLSMFENPSDSFHMFSCDKLEGELWTEKIMLARSYVLLKERTILFQNHQQPPPYTHNITSSPSVSGGGAPSRNMTTRKSTGTLRRPATSGGHSRPSLPSAPLISFKNNTFVEGSLLAKAALASRS